MSFFQNPFGEEFRGSMVTGGERQMSLTFAVPAHKTNGNYWETYNVAPYNFSTYNTLTIKFAIDQNFRNYSSIAINIAGVSAAATTADEVVALLNADVTFSDFFLAEKTTYKYGGTAPPYVIRIKAKKDKTRMRAYVVNTGAEKIMRFNRYAGVAELPDYFERHTVDERFNFPDGTGTLIMLDESDAVYDRPIITDAGFDYSAMKEDWELLAGRTTSVNFQKITVDGSNRPTLIIEYPAGASAGDLAKKTKYTYTSTNTTPSTIAEIPYVLTSGDLITP